MTNINNTEVHEDFAEVFVFLETLAMFAFVTFVKTLVLELELLEFLLEFLLLLESCIILFATGATELTVVVAIFEAKSETELTAEFAAFVAKSETEFKVEFVVFAAFVAKFETELIVVVATFVIDFRALFAFLVALLVRLDTVFIVELSKYSRDYQKCV